ncbi:unnamed protein product [Porites lobata]|uniref:ShKT domain-containing protein n=1 Tax=Porites lobata TaxID=104759 RepID=A0ABN8P0Y3_9CNID|nr:unnamed protein product [Porites lobata]
MAKLIVVALMICFMTEALTSSVKGRQKEKCVNEEDDETCEVFAEYCEDVNKELSEDDHRYFVHESCPKTCLMC